MKQKFRRSTFVKVDNEMPNHMSHFFCGFVGIVDATYSQKFGGKDIKSYAVYQLNDDRTKVINRISWYDEEQLTALPDEEQDRDKAEDMIEEYNLR